MQEIKTGLKLVQKTYTTIMNKKSVNNKVTEDEKYTIYGIFDGLNFLFGVADPKSLEIVINQELF